VAQPEGGSALIYVWLFEPREATWSRLTSDGKTQYLFAWSRDGRQVILEPVPDSALQFLSLNEGNVRTLTHPLGDIPILDWAPDSSYAVGIRQVQATG
jgi:Tol biopolymer transport system component